MSGIDRELKIIAIVCLSLLLSVGCTSATTLVVSKTSPACTSGDEYFTSIQAAVDSANEGDEIIVCSGTYVENVVVDKSLTIRSVNGPDSTIVRATEYPVFEVTADYVEISGFTVKGATRGLFWHRRSGMRLYYADYCNISNNNCSDNGHGISVIYSCNNTIKNNNASSNRWGIRLDYHSFSNAIKSNIVTLNALGITLESSSGYNTLESSSGYNTLVENIVLNNGDGIKVGCDNNIIKNNTVNSNNYNGVKLENSTHNIISNNTANSNGEVGIYLFSNCSHNTVKGNTANSNGDYGIELYTSSHNIIGDNTANLNKEGIYLGGSEYVENYIWHGTGSNNNSIENNVASNNIRGFHLHFSCNNTIKSNIASNNTFNGVNLYHSCNNTLKNNIVSSNLDGIYLYSCDNNIIENNIASNNYGESGICLYGSDKNILKNNILNSNNGVGITLDRARNNILLNNNISSNDFCGVNLGFMFTANNRFGYNNLIDNNIQVWVEGNRSSLIHNYWYDTYLLEGNYWSDYNGTDTDGDGVGDTDTPHPEEGYDLYPFMNKSGWLTFLVSPEYWDFGTVYQGEIVQKTFKMQNALVYNKGREDLNILSITSEPEIGISGIELPIKIQKGSSKVFNVTIDTTNQEGHTLRSIEIQSDDKITPNKTILIYGFVKPPIHDVRIKNIDYQSHIPHILI